MHARVFREGAHQPKMQFESVPVGWRNDHTLCIPIGCILLGCLQDGSAWRSLAFTWIPTCEDPQYTLEDKVRDASGKVLIRAAGMTKNLGDIQPPNMRSLNPGMLQW